MIRPTDSFTRSERSWSMRRWAVDPPATVTAFGAVVRRIRRRTRRSQLCLATRSGLDHSYVSRLESGARLPSRGAVHRLADALDCPDAERRELLRAAGFSPAAEPPPDPLLAELAALAALLADPATTDWARRVIRDGLVTVQELARRATAEGLG